VQCFSDRSLATLLEAGGFRPVAAWYFGMDAYELFVQLGLRRSPASLPPEAAAIIPEFQAVLDAAKFCDDIVVAAAPR
jgi:hypothetical protein